MSRQQHIDSLERQRVAVTRDVEKIAGDTRSARNTIKSSAKQTASSIRDDAKEAVRQITGDARTVAAQASSDTTGAAKAKIKSGAIRTGQAVDPRGFVRDQPLLGVAAGVAVGVLLAMAVGPSRRRVVYSLSNDVS